MKNNSIWHSKYAPDAVCRTRSQTGISTIYDGFRTSLLMATFFFCRC